MEQKNQGKQKKSRSGDSPFKNHHCALTLVFPGVDKTWGCPSISHLSTAPCTTELLKSKQMRQQRSPLQTSCLSSWSPTERGATGSEGSTGWGLIVFLQLRQGPREGQRTAAPLSGTLSFWGVPLYGCTCMLGSGPCRPSFPISRSWAPDSAVTMHSMEGTGRKVAAFYVPPTPRVPVTHRYLAHSQRGDWWRARRRWRWQWWWRPCSSTSRVGTGSCTPECPAGRPRGC